VIFELIYAISIQSYYLIIRLIAPFNSKATLWLKGRQNLFARIEHEIGKDTSEKIWFHCASLGEFEQARPVLESIRNEKPNHKIVLTFFSPSGYEIRKNYAQADYIYYLPLDTKSNAQRFLDLVNPAIVYFVKYEFWYFYLSEIKKRNIPAISFSAIFRSNQIFFKPAGRSYKEKLKAFHKIFVQDQTSFQLLKDQGFDTMEITGDTRFDRVVEIAAAKKEIPLVENFKAGKKCFIIGSSWSEDIKVFMPVLTNYPDIKIIVAPHEIGENNLRTIEKASTTSIRFSQANAENVADKQVLIIDNIGMLSSLYAYADYAAIGGAFGKGLHNTLEAAVFGMPVFFGPTYHKFKEARDLVKLKIAFSIKEAQEFEGVFKSFIHAESLRIETAEKAIEYVKKHTGATQKIINQSLTLLS